MINTGTPLMTTLHTIRAAGPCQASWTRLLAHLDKTCADDELLDLGTVLDSNGLDDALWVLDSALQDRWIARLVAADYAERVLPLFLAVCPDDDRPAAAIRAARDRSATDGDLRAARAASGAAAWSVAWVVRRDGGAGEARGTAAWATAWAAWSARAAWAALAARAARAASGAAAAADAEKVAQTARLRQYIEHGEAATTMPWPDAEDSGRCRVIPARPV